MKRVRYKVLILLHLLLFFYSFSAILGKKAALYSFLSKEFIVYYGVLIFLMAIYAVFWQQIIKRIPLTIAFANKAIMVVWGMVWGHLLFDEVISTLKLIGSVVVMTGIVLYATSDDISQKGIKKS